MSSPEYNVVDAYICTIFCLSSCAVLPRRMTLNIVRGGGTSRSIVLAALHVMLPVQDTVGLSGTSGL